MDFRIHSPFKPTGDQPEAIEKICNVFNDNVKSAVLLGVTGSGKTFTMANVIERLQRPALVLSHNKTLAAQLYGEFKSFFPENAVEYFVSYYDYYQPEAYLPTTDTYIEKDLSINDEIEKLRLHCASTLLSGRRDVIVISSVSCLYGIGNPDDFHSTTVTIHKGDRLSRQGLLYKLVDALYSRTEAEFKRGTFRVKGDSVDIYLAYGDYGCRIIFFDDEIESIEIIDPLSGATIELLNEISIFPANNFVTTKERTRSAIVQIQDDMRERVDYLNEIGKYAEAKRLKQRVEYDLEMIKEIGYCSGIENYSRYFDGRSAGQRPFCLIDYFPRDFLTFVDESHVTLPQVKAMFGGDRSRKNTLIEYGFRLPAAADNRPLTFDEFYNIIGQRLYVSATPDELELNDSEGLIIEQVIRPTGLLDPPIEVRPRENQMDDLLEEVRVRAERDEQSIVVTISKRMAEDLEKYMAVRDIRCRYIHSDVDTMERVEIVEDFKAGRFDVLIGVNLLREGLDIPTVSLVAVLDADREGFLRSTTSLTQTAGRAARNVEGKVIFYADAVTRSMKETMDETDRRRKKQMEYNQANGIVPTQIGRRGHNPLAKEKSYETQSEEGAKMLAEDPVIGSMTVAELSKAIQAAKKKMEAASEKLDFINAIVHRDEMFALQKILEGRK